MITFCLIVTITFLTLCYFYTVKKFKWALKATLCLFPVFLSLATVLPNICLFGSEKVTTIYTDDWNRSSFDIYCDTKDDVYFYRETHLWNPLKCNYRVPVNHEKMEEYLGIERECEEELSKINIFE